MGISLAIRRPRSVFFSRPSDVAIRLWAWTTRGTIWPHMLTTFVEATLSFAIGALCGVVAGFVLARAPFLSALFDPYIRMRQRAAARGTGTHVPAVVRARYLVEGRARVSPWSSSSLFFNTYRGVREVETRHHRQCPDARSLGAPAGTPRPHPERAHLDFFQPAR